MLKKTSMAVMSLMLASAFTMTSIQTADARRGRGAAVAGGIALGILALGAATAYGRSGDRGGCYRGPRECRWVGRECYVNSYGERVCEGGYRECRRPTYCD